MLKNFCKPKEYPKICRICGKNFISHSWCGVYCSKECRKIGRAEYMKNYRPQYMKKLRENPGRLEDYRIYHREWNKTPKGRACGRRALKNYCASEKGKKVRKNVKPNGMKKIANISEFTPENIILINVGGNITIFKFFSLKQVILWKI